jgi:uncharacterized protein (DUF1330 family)
MRTAMAITLIFIFFKSNSQEKVVQLKEGSVISFIASHFHNQEAQQKASAYFEKVFPLAQKYSFRPLIRFNTQEVRNNHFMASGFGIYSWDSQKHFDDFHKEPDWPPLKATRPLYWKSLRSVHLKIDENMKLVFKNTKVYRITYIWLHDFENAKETLENYIMPMRQVIHRLGGRFVVGFDSATIKSMSCLNNDRLPDRIAITEWPDEKTHDKYISSTEFKEKSKHFFASVAEFEAFDTRVILE